jgi:hypothetical protein
LATMACEPDRNDLVLQDGRLFRATVAGGPFRLRDIALTVCLPGRSGFERALYVGESSPEAVIVEVSEVEVTVEVGGVV